MCIRDRLWDGRAASRSWADGLTRNHIAFDLMQDYYINQEHLNQYPLAIVPDGVLKEKGVQEAVEIYVKQGGRVIVENTDSDEASFAHECLGIEPDVRAGEYLTASYLRFEEAGALLKKDMDTDKIAFRGAVSYCSPAQGSQMCIRDRIGTGYCVCNAGTWRYDPCYRFPGISWYWCCLTHSGMGHHSFGKPCQYPLLSIFRPGSRDVYRTVRYVSELYRRRPSRCPGPKD